MASLNPSQSSLILIFISITCLHYTTSSLSVPLITWSNNEKVDGSPTVTAGETKDISVVYKEHIEPLIKAKQIVLVFLQDELSADDFTKYASSFPHLQKTFHTKNYLLFPTVSKENNNINELIGKSGSEIENVDSGSVGNWEYQAPLHAAHKVVVLQLEPVSGSHSKGKAEILERNDVAMHRIIKMLKEKVKDFGVVYTAEDPSPMVADILLNENIVDPSVSSRHILATTANSTKKFFNNSCVLMYIKSMKLKSKDNNETEFITHGAEWDTKGCGSNSVGCSIGITRLGQVGHYANVTLLIEFKNDTQQWHCDLVVISGKYGKRDFSSNYTCGGHNSSTGFESAVHNTMSAPLGMSFACQDVTFMSDNHTHGLILGGIQLQTMCDGRGALKQFSSAFHCVGFFTIEILTGIFVTVVLMIGLYVGISMMMAIQVQDRYDDPKGKTITITAAHNE